MERNLSLLPVSHSFIVHCGILFIYKRLLTIEGGIDKCVDKTVDCPETLYRDKRECKALIFIEEFMKMYEDNKTYYHGRKCQYNAYEKRSLSYICRHIYLLQKFFFTFSLCLHTIIISICRRQ